MKMTPIAASSAVQNANANPMEGRSASAERIARAKAVASGQAPAEPSALPASPAADKPMRTIKMRTQRSTNVPTPVETPPELITNSVGAEPVKTDPIEPAQGADATRALDPQAVELAKAKREFQIERARLAAEKTEFEKTKGIKPPGLYSKEDLKANALAILREVGVPNESLTEQLLNEASDFGPAYTKIESVVKQLQEKVEAQSAALLERDKVQETQVLSQIRDDATQLVAIGDEYETVRETENGVDMVVDLIHETFKKKQKILSVEEAAAMLEPRLLKREAERFAKLSKVRSRMSPEVERQAPAKQDAANVKIMRTLSNRDGVSPVPTSRRDRAIAAAEGRLKR